MTTIPTSDEARVREPDGPAVGRSGPTPDTERSLAPDLARGCVLLFIALANVSGYLYGREVNAGYRPVDGGALANVLDLLVTLVVDNRSRPMFAMLFGYGTWHMLHRQVQAGATRKQARRLVVRRNVWLIVFGLAHATLLFGGDILAAYGISGLVALVVWDRSLRVRIGAAVAGSAMSLVAVVVAETLMSPGTKPVEAGSNYLHEAVIRVVGALAEIGLIGVLMTFVAPLLIGAAVASAGLLERPWDHRPLLRRLAAGGIATGLVGGLPFALITAGWWNPSSATSSLASALHLLTGLAAGLGYLAAFGLWAARRRGQSNDTPFAFAVKATGKRSLSCYLMQSVVLAPLLSAWGLGVGGSIGTPTAYIIALGTWASTVAFAVLLERQHRRGPAEVLLRHLTYRTPRNA